MSRVPTKILNLAIDDASQNKNLLKKSRRNASFALNSSMISVKRKKPLSVPRTKKDGA